MLPVLSVYALQDGGTAIVFWALIAGVIGMMFVYSSLAEMASMYVNHILDVAEIILIQFITRFPTAGGKFAFADLLSTEMLTIL